ncbi:MAG: hypothetical protein RLZZ74_3443 [Cyanobacteriota bacterium]|jgi:hypothetical protein
MRLTAKWSDFKSFVDSRSISIQWVDIDSNYFLYATDDAFQLDCIIPKDGSAELEFETSYKSKGNIVTPQINSAFSSKNLGSKKLFARNTGKQFMLGPGPNDLIYTATFPWVKMIGLECIGAESLDYGELRVYDSAAGTYSGVPNLLLNQFGYTLNIAKDFYKRESPFDADLYAGMVLKITYTSMSSKTIGINYIMNEVK